MLIKRYDYPAYVIKCVKEFYSNNYEMELTTQQVQEMPKLDVLRTYLHWEGIIGYEGTIYDLCCAKEIKEK